MYLKRFILRHFRNFKEAELEFSPKVNLLRGDNAQGKTNLLEAIYFLSTGRSFRTVHLQELIQSEAPFLSLEAEFFKDEMAQTIKLSYDGQSKKMVHNTTAYSHFTNLLGLLPTVILAPEDIELIVGPPQIRRRFLDLHLAQLDPVYVYHLSRYFKAMKQRNFLLRQSKQESIEGWEAIMMNASSYVHQKRSLLIQELQVPIEKAMSHLSDGKDHLEIRYLPSLSTDYGRTRAKELEACTTFIGPHRDDFTILINGKEAKAFASQGQRRGAITSLKIGEWEHFYTLCHSTPLFSIDDFGIHLDSFRSRLLLDKLSSLGQVFLTSPYAMETSGFQSFEITSGHL